MNVLVSVIIPVYNTEAYLKECIDSVLHQTHKNIEIILIDDGSKDGSPQICDDYAAAHPFISVVHQKNAGVSSARNAGIAVAKGDFLTFLDSDDTLPNTALSSLLSKAMEENADLTIGKIFKHELLPLGTFRNEDLLRMALDDVSIAYYACRILYKRTFLTDLRFPVGRVTSEDSFFVFQCALKLPVVATIDEVVYFYRQTTTSVTHQSFTKKKYDDTCYLLNRKEQIIKEDFAHLTNDFFNLKLRIQIALLRNFLITPGRNLRAEEQQTLLRFSEYKNFLKKDIPYNKRLFIIFGNRLLYVLYKKYVLIRQKLRQRS